jgi:hypothetical protein
LSFGLYMIGFDEAYAKLSPGKGIVGRTIRAAIESGYHRFDEDRAGKRGFPHAPDMSTVEADAAVPRVLIAACDPPRLVSRLPAMFVAGGCRVVALCPDDTSLARSWMIERHISVERDAERLVAALHEEIQRQRYDFVVVGDEDLLHALGSRVQPWMNGVLPFAADEATCALVLDKNAMLRAMAGRGVPIPPFVTASSPDELAGAAERIGYPLLLKAAAGCGSAGIRRVDAPDQLLLAYADLAPAGEIAVQRFLRARSGCTDVIFDRGVPRAWTSAYMLGQWPTPLHPATLRKPVSVPGVDAMLRAVGDATRFHGLAGIDWIEDEAGSLYFLELNARPTHVVGPARAAFGRELGAMVRGTPAAPHEVRLPPRAIPVFPSHFVRALKTRPLDLLQWLPFRASSADLDWRDFGVVSAELGAMAAGAARRLAGRRSATDDVLTATTRRPRPHTG